MNTPLRSLDASADPWLRQLAAGSSPADAPVPGRVLRAKIGYNPNSSSVGSVVTVLVWSATTASVVLSLLQARVGAVARSDGDGGDGT